LNIQNELDGFKLDLIELLRHNLVQIYITGSYSLDDFRVGRGDLDFIVVTKAEIAEKKVPAIWTLFESYRYGKSVIKRQLEGTFIPIKKLIEPKSDALCLYVGTSRQGWRTTHLFPNAMIDLKLLLKTQKKLFADFDCDIYEPSNEELKNERKNTFRNYKKYPEAEAMLSYAHWLCRTIFLLDKGEIVSKTEACKYVTGCLTTNEDKHNSMLFSEMRDPAEDGFLTNYSKFLPTIQEIENLYLMREGAA